MSINEYDAIVVGTGISGGWAAKELTESGLKTLVLERGRMIEHVTDYHTAHLDPWDMDHGGRPTKEDLKDNLNKVEQDIPLIELTVIFLLMILNIHTMKKNDSIGCEDIM